MPDRFWKVGKTMMEAWDAHVEATKKKMEQDIKEAVDPPESQVQGAMQVLILTGAYMKCVKCMSFLPKKLGLPQPGNDDFTLTASCPLCSFETHINAEQAGVSLDTDGTGTA